MTRRRLTVAQKVALFRDHDGRCHVCAGKITPGEAWEVEHVVPLALGGADDASNLAPAHKKGCHERKTREQDVPEIARAKRREARHLGVGKPTSRPMPGSRASGWRIPFRGRPERRL